MINKSEHFRYWREYFTETEDYKSKIWDFRPDSTSDILQGNKDFRFGDATWYVTLIDSYKGRKPLLWSKDALTNNTIKIFVIPTLLLDSQILNELHAYVNNYYAIESVKKVAIYKFLRFCTIGQWEISPIFYSIEALNKSDPERREAFVCDRLRTLFKLQTMDLENFKLSGLVVSDGDRQKQQLAFHGANSLDEYIEKQRDVLLECNNDSEVYMIADVCYASLLKMSLVHREQSSVESKYLSMRAFFEKEIGVVGGLEQLLALCYFVQPQKYQKFLPPLQQKMNWDKFCRKLRASAWDMLLLRLPTMLSGAKSPHLSASDISLSLNYVCTAEHALRDVARPQATEMIFDLIPELGGTSALLAIDLEEVERLVGQEVSTELVKKDFVFVDKRMRQRKERETISIEALRVLVRDLDSEAKTVCIGGEREATKT